MFIVFYYMVVDFSFFPFLSSLGFIVLIVGIDIMCCLFSFQLAASFESRIARVVLLVLVYAASFACIFARVACIFSYQNLNLESVACFPSSQDYSRAALIA